ncbi:ORC-CDC6 family AAA ATPase [Tenacibaculum discolor]|uniref:ORC-CDC6 family AAA ATPase n=1 Tax=Tenacibaculum discolor TaxID=361581 RepID=UPI000EAC43D9|nr:hypothetical protein [Tenacibaculum discolor]RLJ98800.1 hypothetical protein C8N27_2708 [Tenacibaculum discolor]
MSKFENPFTTDRAEHLGDKLFEFYASNITFEGLLRKKSLILQGGRGSGKTMFYLYNSYFNKKRESESNKIAFNNFLKNQNILGIHFRADSNFVPAFQHKGLDDKDWIALFSHYLNINLTKRLLEVIIDINKFSPTEKITFEIADEVELLLNEKNITDFESFLKKIKIHEIKLISYINHTVETEKPRSIINGFLLNTVAKSILNQPILKNKTIHIFIDEYENMLLYQQRIINTLIKHPDPVVFDIGMRKEGLKTYQTLADSEIISAPHDFKPFDMEELSDEEYEELILKICRKRLSRVKLLSNENLDSKLLDISYYLGKYDYKEEIAKVFKKQNIDKLKIKIKNRIGSDPSLKILHEIDNTLILRLNLVLLDRGNKANDLALELEKYTSNEHSKYEDWIHNNKMGVIFLLCKESRKQKAYSGFNTYKSLSSGISRYFIELCEAAFQNAYRNGFSFEDPRPFSYEEQTKAAIYISKYKVNDIETYTPYSVKLRRFTLLLGQIFQKLHWDLKLSEPERNHFTTEYDKLSVVTKEFLKSSILYSVLQRKEETKDKNDSIDSNKFEYHLNHIYAPYFNISARKIRSLKIKASNLNILINGETGQAEKIANSFVKDITKDETNQLKIDL